MSQPEFDDRYSDDEITRNERSIQEGDEISDNYGWYNPESTYNVDEEFAGMLYNSEQGFWQSAPDDQVVICQRCKRPSIDPIDDELCDGCMSIVVYEEEEKERRAEEARYKDRIARKVCVQCGRRPPIRGYRCKLCIERDEQELDDGLPF